MMNGVQGNTHPQLPLPGLRRPTASGPEQNVRATDGEARKLLAQLFSASPGTTKTAATRAVSGNEKNEPAPHLGRYLDVMA